MAHVEFSKAIPYHLTPFHPGSDNRPPTFATSSVNGKRAFAKLCGIPTVDMPLGLAKSMSAAEDSLQQRMGVDVIGPTDVDGLPISLVTAIEKMKAVMAKLTAGGVTTDAHYTISMPGHDFSIHQPKTEKGRRALLEALRDASQVQGALLSTQVGIVRKNLNDGFEFFTADTELGDLIPLSGDDMAQIEARMRAHPSVAMGTTTMNAPGLFVPNNGMYHTTVRRFVNPGNGWESRTIGGQLVPARDKAIIEISGDRAREKIHRFALGFIT